MMHGNTKLKPSASDSPKYGLLYPKQYSTEEILQVPDRFVLDLLNLLKPELFF